MADTLPLRFRVLHYVSTVDKASAGEIMKALKPEYGTEKQFTKKVFVDHLLDMKANFILDDNDVELDDKENWSFTTPSMMRGEDFSKSIFPKGGIRIKFSLGIF